ncbi:MAG TPA: type II secretion system F family protein [Baekduia sp.]|nr:type II secretion system F family protein [Baekduia sp.]
MIGRTLITATAVAALGLVAPIAAPAKDGLAIEPSATAAFPTRTMVLSLPGRQSLTAADVALREDGRQVGRVRVEPVAGSRRTGTVLVIDASRSMHGDAIQRAMAAARAFARRRPAGATLGVIFFARTPTVALEPTTDAARIDAVLAHAPVLSKGTRALDAAAAGVRMLAATAVPAGSVVLLSDGADVGSATTIDALASVSRHTRTRIFTVGLDSASVSRTTLGDVARVGRGSFVPAARAKDLPSVFAALGDRLASEYLLTYRSDARLGRNVLVEARVAGVPGRALTTYDTPPLPTAYRPDRAPAATAQRLDPMAMGIIAGLAALLAGTMAFVLVRTRTRSIRDRVADFAGDGRSAAAIAAAEQPRVRRPRSERWKRVAEQLELAGIPMSPERFVAAVGLATLVLVYVAIATGRAPLAALALGAPFAARALVASRVGRRRRAFDEQLPDTLQLVASALRAGHSFAGALDHAASGAPEPACSELRRAVLDERVGVPVDEALGAVGRRMGSVEIEYVGIVARQQSQTGGNSAEVLDRVVVTTRERQALRRQVQTLTAQGRLGGAVLSAMPIALGALIAVIRPGYLAPLYDNATGLALIAACAVLLVIGWVAIRRIVNIAI